jgi:hypothetical protein
MLLREEEYYHEDESKACIEQNTTTQSGAAAGGRHQLLLMPRYQRHPAAPSRNLHSRKRSLNAISSQDLATTRMPLHRSALAGITFQRRSLLPETLAVRSVLSAEAKQTTSNNHALHRCLVLELISPGEWGAGEEKPSRVAGIPLASLLVMPPCSTLPPAVS